MSDDNLRISGIIEQSIVDGPGLRYVVFTQGCPHRCEGCHNPETHDYLGGRDKSVEQILSEFSRNPLLKGITVSGGEPLEQGENVAKLCAEIKKIGKDTILYTGYMWEEILKGADEKNHWRDVISACDYLIDGKFLLRQKTLMLPFKGSTNQRFIDVEKSLAQNKIVEVD